MTNLGGTGVSENTDFDDEVTALLARQDRLNPATLAIAISDSSIQLDDIFKVQERSTGNGGSAFWKAVLKASVTVSAGAPAIGNIVASTADLTLAFVLQRDVLDEIHAATYGGVIDFGTDNTAVVQSCIDTLSADPLDIDSGGLIIIPRGMHFNPKNINFVMKQNLKYFISDEKSTTSISTLNTNELVTFAANANNAGIVNETRFVAPFHPGIGIDVRKDILGHTDFLKGAQSQDDPVRVSFNMYDEQRQVSTWKYRASLETDTFSGLTVGFLLNRVSLTDITTSSFDVLPEEGDFVTGFTSGAYGHMHTIDGTEMILIWGGGKFIDGETIVNNRGTIADPINEGSSNPVTTALTFAAEGQLISWGRSWGEISIGLPSGVTDGVFSVGGRSTVTNTRVFGQEIKETITEPVRSWVDSLEAATPEGRDIVLDKSRPVGKKRLVVRDYKSNLNMGAVGTTTVFTIVNNFLSPSASHYNILSITNPSTGNYTVTLKDDFITNESVIELTLQNGTGSMADIQVELFTTTTSTIQLRVFTQTTGALINIPTSMSVHVHASGGDF